MAHESPAHDHEPATVKETSIQICPFRRFPVQILQRTITRVGTTTTARLARAGPPDLQVSNTPFRHTRTTQVDRQQCLSRQTRHPATARYN